MNKDEYIKFLEDSLEEQRIMFKDIYKEFLELRKSFQEQGKFVEEWRKKIN